MLAYAFENLNEEGYKEVATEDFEHVADLLAAILAKGIGNQLKKGLSREYVRQEAVLSGPKGKLDLTASVKQQVLMKKQVVCQYDEFSEDIYLNQILKTTAMLLIRTPEVKLERKRALKKNLLFFSHVQEIEVYTIKWSDINYHKNNANYKMLINICYLIVKGMLLSTEEGTKKLASFIDDQRMSSLYERFVRAYYRKHYPHFKVSAAYIPWALSEDKEKGYIDFLPAMKTDITIENKDKILIIDTKYYGRTMQNNAMYNSQSFHSNNMYQIFTYVKNKDVGQTGKVSGVLLYAKTDEAITPDHEYMMSGNKISVKTLALDGDFESIKAQLAQLVEEIQC